MSEGRDIRKVTGKGILEIRGFGMIGSAHNISTGIFQNCNSQNTGSCYNTKLGNKKPLMPTFG